MEVMDRAITVQKSGFRKKSIRIIMQVYSANNYSTLENMHNFTLQK